MARKRQTLALRPGLGIEARYAAKLESLVDRMTRVTLREVRALFESPVAVESHVTTDASISSQARMLTNALTDRFSVLFAQRSKPIATEMVNGVERQGARDLFRSLREVSEDVTLSTTSLRTGAIADIAKASVAESVSLIKSIPAEFLGKVQGAVMRSIQTGNGLQDLLPFMEKQAGMTKRRAFNIAHDQTRKAYNGIAAGRMKAAGIESFEWVHTGGGQKPRQEHIDLSGQVFRFDDLPIIDSNTGERGTPGVLPNCRCIQRPIVDFSIPDE